MLHTMILKPYSLVPELLYSLCLCGERWNQDVPHADMLQPIMMSMQEWRCKWLLCCPAVCLSFWTHILWNARAMFIHSGECRAFIRKRLGVSKYCKIMASWLESIFVTLSYFITYSIPNWQKKPHSDNISQNGEVSDDTNYHEVKDANIVWKIFWTQLRLIAWERIHS